MSLKHICQGGPRDLLVFTLTSQKTEFIGAGDNLPGRYRRSGETDSEGRTIWKYQKLKSEP